MRISSSNEGLKARYNPAQWQRLGITQSYTEISSPPATGRRRASNTDNPVQAQRSSGYGRSLSSTTAKQLNCFAVPAAGRGLYPELRCACTGLSM
jgi:hypothetical protein